MLRNLTSPSCFVQYSLPILRTRAHRGGAGMSWFSGLLGRSGAAGGGAAAAVGGVTTVADTHARAIADRYNTLDEVKRALIDAGLESSSLILAIDFTSSNASREQSQVSFSGRPLHSLDAGENLYEQALGVIARTLESFDEDGYIPTYGFGCSRTHNDKVFAFRSADAPCVGLADVLATYRALAPAVRLAGPTSFDAVIRKAIEIVRASNNAYHILVILCDGQITRSVETPEDEFSDFERKTVDAIVEASHYPLSIVVVGIGDGPWETMRAFDDKLPAREFDNFQFVDFHSSRQHALGLAPHDEPARTAFVEAMFARDALQEIPGQFASVARYLGARSRRALLEPGPVETLDPPVAVPPLPPQAAHAPRAAPEGGAGPPQRPVTAAAGGGGGGAQAAPAPRECLICCARPPDTVLLPCGHLSFCSQCVDNAVAAVQGACPLCRRAVTGTNRVFF